MTPDRPIFGQPLRDPRSVAPPDEDRGIGPDGKINHARSTGGKRSFYSAVVPTRTLLTDGPTRSRKEEVIPERPTWLIGTRMYQRWLKSHLAEKYKFAYLFYPDGQNGQRHVYTCDTGFKSLVQEGNIHPKAGVVLDCVLAKSLAGFSELVVAAFRFVEPGGLVAVHYKSTRKIPDTELEGFTDWLRTAHLSRERILVTDDGKSLSVVGLRWKDGEREPKNIQTSVCYRRWLREALVAIDHKLIGHGIEGVDVRGRKEFYVTKDIPRTIKELLAGAGMVITFTCGCQIDRRKDANREVVRSLECLHDKAGCGYEAKAVDVLLKQVFGNVARCEQPFVCYANSGEDQQKINGRLRNYGIGGRYESGHRVYDHNAFAGQHFIDAAVLELEHGVVGIEPGDGIVFQVGKQLYYGIAILVRGYEMKADGANGPDLKILILEEQQAVENRFSRYF